MKVSFNQKVVNDSKQSKNSKMKQTKFLLFVIYFNTSRFFSRENESL